MKKKYERTTNGRNVVFSLFQLIFPFAVSLSLSLLSVSFLICTSSIAVKLVTKHLAVEFKNYVYYNYFVFFFPSLFVSYTHSVQSIDNRHNVSSPIATHDTNVRLLQTIMDKCVTIAKCFTKYKTAYETIGIRIWIDCHK